MNRKAYTSSQSLIQSLIQVFTHCHSTSHSTEIVTSDFHILTSDCLLDFQAPVTLATTINHFNKLFSTTNTINRGAPHILCYYGVPQHISTHAHAYTQHLVCLFHIPPSEFHKVTPYKVSIIIFNRLTMVHYVMQ